MPSLYQLSIASTIIVCLMAALANVLLARRYVRRDAALALALGFLLNAITWILVAVLPPVDRISPDYNFLLFNTLGGLGLTTLWCGFWLRSGYRINSWLVGGLLSLWLLPAAAILLFDLPWWTHIPFAAASISLGLMSCIWTLFNKPASPRNPGDWGLIVWFLIILPIAVSALILGVTSARNDPNVEWMLYLNALPAMFAGVALFTLLGFALDAIRDSTELALSDSLTGLMNRRAFDREMLIAAARAERYGRKLSLILLDIDNFKLINDEHGHQVGDSVIRSVGRVMMEKCRSVDIAARIGGEEFALILQDTPVSAALRLAERLREAVAGSGNTNLVYTASFGVASTDDTGPKGDALFKAADEALYAAKDAGRNCVRYAPHPDRDVATLIGSTD